MSTELTEGQKEWIYPGVDLPLPDAELRKVREAVVMQEVAAEMSWDIDGIVASFPRGAVFRVQPFEETPLVGKEAIKNYFDHLRNGFPDSIHDLHLVHHTATALIMEAQIRGPQAEEFRGIPSKGKSVDVPVAVFFHFDGEVLVDKTLYFDMSTFQRQLA